MAWIRTDEYTHSTPDRLRPWIQLLAAFVEHGMPAAEFEQRYLELSRSDPGDQHTPPEGRVLGDFFNELDSFVADPTLRAEPEFDIDENQLRRSATLTLAELRRLDSQIKR